MAGIANEEFGIGRTEEGILSMQSSGEALAEWRSSDQVEKGTPSTSPPYWDTDDDDEDEDGWPKPSELFGKHTWKIENFSQINKRELRSSIFDAGGYKWYILIYPQGCDVCNHLSLFLCVANHDKLLPGWSHFAQFTIAVVNKDPKKSKYSDTLHRFWKKEHDWGWKKFMELSKLYDGFIDGDSLIIKAQVQVIREKADRPFRCLDSQYRRELLRVYLTNVEQICRRFVEDRRGNLSKLIEDKSRWSSFCTFWLGTDQNVRRHMSKEKMDVILKVVVKQFFIEKEVTSTLVMDSLYSGLKALESQSKSKKGRVKPPDVDCLPAPIVALDKDMFVLVDDVLILLERAATEPLPPKDEKGPQNRTKDGSSGEDFNKDTIERDERRLTELGRRTVEIFVLDHIFSNNIEVAYQEAVALKRQEELIREEEEEAWLAESEQRSKRGANLKEKKLKKKQAKQKRLNRKAKDKERDERLTLVSPDDIPDEDAAEEKDDIIAYQEQPVVEKSEAAGDVSDTSDLLDGVGEVLQHDSDGRDTSPVNWDTDASEVHPPVKASGSAGSNNSPLQNGMTEKRSPSMMDDSSSTCSTDSVLSAVTNGTYKGNSLSSNYKKQQSSGRVKNQRVMENQDAGHPSKTENDPAGPAGDMSESNVECVSRTAEPYEVDVASPQKQSGRVELNATKKDGPIILHKGTAIREQVNVEKPVKEKPFAGRHLSNGSANARSRVPAKLEPSSNSVNDISSARKAYLNGQQYSDVISSLTTSSPTGTASNPRDMAKSTLHVPGFSRPSSASLVPGIRPLAPQVSVVSTSPALSRSVSAIEQLIPDPLTSSHNYVPLSYRNAIIGSSAASTSSSMLTHPSSPSTVGKAPPYMSPQTSVTSQVMLPPSNDGMEYNGVRPRFPYGAVGQDIVQNGPTQWLEGIDCKSARHDIPLQSDRISGDHYRSSFRSRNDLSDVQAGTSGRQSNGSTAEDFPHMDIIKELLDDDVNGRFARMANVPFQPSGGRPHLLSRHSSFSHDVPGISGNLDSPSPSLFEAVHRSRSFRINGINQGYGFSSNFDSLSGFSPHVSSLSHANGPSDGLIHNQWRFPGSELSGLGMKGPEEESYPFYSNYLACSVNGGYPSFRPPNGH
ncbi:hypothetical protein MLD38_011972 [Melastoma candidum]|uniref:Uncharacterized protein n=1 Tax=Melastoma candidum TaxID=119954 RepID=A0ACB9R4V2_9MYRT|nr:hypothetical protein MLD38_011972 [Melastoma candidum]